MGPEADDYTQDEGQEPRTNSREYDRAIKDAVVWLAQNNQNYRPECLAGALADDLLSQ